MSSFWVPFAQTDRSVLYGDLRMMGDNQDNREGNLGLGYRHMTSAPIVGDGVAGVHGWLDRRITERGSTFNQLTLGTEWLGENVDLRLNGYVPLSSGESHDIPNANPQGPSLAGTGIVVDTNGKVFEEPQHGFDLELGFELGQHIDFIKDHTDSLRVYGGGYYFNSENTQDVAGMRTRFTADINTNIQVGARFQRDDERGSQGFLEATFRFPFGSKKSYRKEGLRARLDESAERDIDIVTGEAVTDTGDRVQVLNAQTGTVQEVLHVNNQAAGGGDGSADNPFNTLADAQGAASAQTIIYVNAGDGTSSNQDQGITLNQTGQQLIGSGVDFVYDSGRFSTANGATPTSILIAPASAAPVIGNVNAGQDGVSVSADNITVAGITVDNANTGRDGIVVKADGAGASAQNITIQNVTAQNNRMGVYIHGTNDGAVSAKVQSTIATANSQHGIAVYDDTNGAFEADLGGGSMGSTGNNVLAGNTLEDLAVEYDGRELAAQNNWWGQASGPDTDAPDVGIAPQIYYGAPINDGLVGHWTFDNEWTSNTTAFDRSGLGNDGTLQNGLSLADQVVGNNREALEFDGVDDRVSIPNSAELNPGISDYSISFSLNTTSNSSALIAGKNTFAFNSYGVWYRGSNGELEGEIKAPNPPGTAHSPAPNAINDGSWQFSTNTNDRDGLGTVYQNDAAIQSLDISGISTESISNSVAFTIGRGNPGRFDGSIDDVRLYMRALSANEVLELYRMDTSSSVNVGGFLTAAP